MSCDRILQIIRVRHMGRYARQSVGFPLLLYMCTISPSTHSCGSCAPFLVRFIIVIGRVIHGAIAVYTSPDIPSPPCGFCFLIFAVCFVFLCPRIQLLANIERMDVCLGVLPAVHFLGLFLRLGLFRIQGLCVSP